MTDDGLFKAVRRGSIRSGIDVDLRRFLLEGPHAPERKQAEADQPDGPGQSCLFGSPRPGAAVS